MLAVDATNDNLDRWMAELMTKLLLELQKQSVAMLIAVTHSDALAKAMNRKAELVDGLLVET